jgi:hypothetical protein
MKKPAFSRKPTPQQPDPQEHADGWVARRAAVGEPIQEPEPLPEPERAVKAEPIVRMTFDLSKSLHRRFRRTCHNLDRNMTDELRAFVVRYLEENEGKQS